MEYEYNNLKYEVQGKGITITGVVDNFVTSLDIPSQIDGVPVRIIGFRAFAGRSNSDSCKRVVSVNIPDSVVEIASGAFIECISLEKIKIPSSVARVGRSAFFNCASLSEVEISNSLAVLSGTAFENCRMLKGITICHDAATSVKDGGHLSFLTRPIGRRAEPPHVDKEAKKEFVFIPKDNSGIYSVYVEICSKNFSWSRYDELFNSRIPLNGKIQVALFRLNNPVELSEAARDRYLACLKEHGERVVRHYVETDNLEMLIKFGTLDMIKRENINDYIEFANAYQKRNVLLYLVSYRHKKFKNQ